LQNIIFILIIFIYISNYAQNNVGANLKYNSYYGGNESDEGRSIAIDNQKNFYLFGFTLSTDLPTTPNSFQDTLKGSYDVFIAKFDSFGNHIWTTYLGGSNVEIASTIKTTHDNNLILLGYTNSIDFPTTPNAYQSFIGGQYDVFITKIDTSGQLIWSTFFGGIGSELGIDLTIDLNNNLIIGGQTNSSNFPYTLGAFQPLPLGGNDAFIAKFNSLGQLIWATCYGGTSTEDIHAITHDFENNIIITGMTNSNDLAISSNAIQTTNNGFFDIYIAKFSSNGNFLWSTYYGGSNYDDIYGVQSDSLNNLYFAGITLSNDFITTPNAFQTSKNNGNDACIFKLSKNGDLIWSTYIGGDNDDAAYKIYIDKNNNVTTLINTLSDTLSLHSDTVFTNYPLSLENVYIITIDSSGIPLWSTYFGGDNNDRAYDLKILSDGNLYFFGSTESSNLPFTSNAFQASKNLYSDCYIGIIYSNLYFTDTSYIASNFIKSNKLKNFILYPNPAEMYICFNENLIDNELSIFNINGQLIKKEKISHPCIDLEKLNPGIYIVEIIGKENIKREKFIKH
jgi:hypothetical protein